ncbi:MAG: NACHT domain-containing protein [Sulfuriferula sp.]
MDEGKVLVADFVAKNIDKIWAIGKQVVGVTNAVIQVKLKSAYTNYLSTTREKYSKGKSFFIRNEPVDLYTYYVPTGIACGNITISAPSFRECVELSKRIVITGSGGSGKSILMKHLFLDCIRDKTYAPILIELRDLNTDDKTLDEIIDYTLDNFGFNISGDYVKRAKHAGHFCFFFDGYDEVNPTSRKKLVNQITALSKKFSRCPIFLSSRPDDVFNGIEDFSVFGIQPLNLDLALKLVEKLPFDNEIKEKFCSDLAKGLFKKHESFLSNPLLLSIMLLTYGENAEIPSKLSIFYNQAYEALFQRHDANKGGFSRKRLTSLDIQDFSRVFSLFALQTYEKRLFKMSRSQCLSFIEKCINSLQLNFKPEEYLTDLLSAACLLVEDGLEITFSHRSFQEYFVALQISSAAPDIQRRLIDRYWPNIRSDNVIELLLEINPDLVERELIVPQLELLFSEIGVKRKVGITHATRYFKRIYSSLNIEKGTVSATHMGPKAAVSSILQIAVMHYSRYEFPDNAHFEMHHSAINKVFGRKDERVEYKSKLLTYRSPLIEQVIVSGGIFSKQFLNAGFEAFKELKYKHMNTVQNLDILLGIP